MDVPASTSFEATVTWGATGLVGTLGVSITSNQGTTIVARTTAGIIEYPPGSGIYATTLTSPPDSGQYSIVWDDGSAFAAEDLTVSGAGFLVTGPPLEPIEAATTDVCSLWASVDDAYDCCPDLATEDLTAMEWALTQASDLLYNLSGHRYPGVCEATVRPCASYVSCWEPVDRWLSRDCGCDRLSTIRLAGYPVQEIVEVLIDDEVIAPYDYRLQKQRELVRLNGETWPACQNLEYDSGEGTFFVTYTYGLNPPVAGVSAAAQLACQIARQCPGGGTNGATADCDLPAGTVRISRQGLTIDTQELGLWMLGALRTGMPLVDSFLAVYGGQRRRRTAIYAPEQNPWPLRVG